MFLTGKKVPGIFARLCSERRDAMKMQSTRIVLLCCLLFAAGRPLRAREEPKTPQSADAGVVWELKYDRELNGRLDGDTRGGDLKLTAKKNVITAAPSGGDLTRGDKWSGLFIVGRVTLIQLREDGLNGYARVLSGKQVNHGPFLGTWHDNDGGSGDFELTLKKK